MSIILRNRGEQDSGIRLTYAILLQDVLTAHRADPYYHQERFLALEKALESSPFEIEPLRNIVEHLDYGLMPMEDYAEDAQSGEPFIRVTNILPSGDIDLTDVKYIPSATAKQSQKRVKSNDIIMVQCGSTTGKVAIVPEELEGSLYASFCFAIRAKSDTNPKYLFEVLDSRLVQEQIQRTWNVVSVRPNTSKPDVEALSVPLPPLPVQQQMVEEMEQKRESRRRKLAKADALLSGLDAFLLERLGLTGNTGFSKSVFAIRYQDLQKRLDPKTYLYRTHSTSKPYPTVTLGSLTAQEPDYGSGSRAVERISEDQAKYIRITDFQDDGIPLGHQFMTAEVIEAGCELADQDMLFARSGATAGKTFLYSADIGPAIFAGYCIRFRFDRKQVLPRFVYHFTKTSVYRA